jgi:hypothetical protein
MGLVAAVADVVLSDDYTERATIMHGAFDRADVTVYGGDALLQFMTPQGGWEPQNGLLVRKGLFRSLPGLLTVYGPTGPRAIRLKRAAAGVASTIDLELWGID